ncbi:MAG: metallophosphoesterase [Bacteroidota bacterium]|nr:metallophosphoesterase [Bacteroidota bacterium]MDP4215648.1 metallophosphoesterase [Bacteroidota bacterium]MDP4252914.1 metallophosphoesterase [Bacteroidota bacterium]MDP4259762.1 metallophosphoesterase [Bacteroidota bacterium]
MKQLIYLLFFFVSLFVDAQDKNDGHTIFVANPYLQIGETPSAGTMDICWQTNDEDASWRVEIKAEGGEKWVAEPKLLVRTVSVPNVAPRRIFTVSVADLAAGSVFSYRLIRNKKVVFSSEGRASKSPQQAFRFVAMGDIGAGTTDAKLIAEQAALAKPDMVVIPGDIVYEHGLVSEYDKNFWPVYNADSTTHSGATLMRSVPFVATPGNHDTEERNFNNYPDALAYFMFWDQPVNGPASKEGGPAYPSLIISDSARKSFVSATGSRFPTMTNFSFDYGNAHFLMLDANPYVDWTSPALKDWLKKDLAAASGSTWKFVVFHHPGFSSSREHFEQQQMRLLSPIFDEAKVDVVFSGHVHNYQRSFPMSFVPDNKGVMLVGGKDNKTIRGRVVNGKWTLDKHFDGSTNTKAIGVIYIVTGAGGQELYNPEQAKDPDSWQKFTYRFLSTVHSFGVIDVNGKSFRLRQVDMNGNTIDEFSIIKD